MSEQEFRDVVMRFLTLRRNILKLEVEKSRGARGVVQTTSTRFSVPSTVTTRELRSHG